jgi:hypothetical protein
MTKKVLTFSWLMRKAMALFKKDQDAYRQMVINSGTDKILRGALVRFEPGHSYTPAFHLFAPGGNKRYVSLRCQHRAGKTYTTYELHFTTTEYRKRLDKYLPITLPEGVRSSVNTRGRDTKCIVHNADGSVACETHFTGGRPRKPGYCGKPLVICDDTGKFVGGTPIVSGFSHYGGNCNARLLYGWMEGASRNRTEWLESIKAMPAGTCDHKKMLTVAAKAYLTVTRLMEKYPHLRMAMFPADVVTEGSWQHYRGRCDGTRQTVVYRSADGTPTMWHLPEVLMYWMEDDPAEGLNIPVPKVSILIPPHGNPLLDPRGKAAQTSRTARDPSQARRRFDPTTVPLGWEQAYHSLLAWKPGVKNEGTPLRDHLVRAFDETGSTTEIERSLTIWPEHEDKALVTLECDETSDVPGCPFPMDTPMAMKPEDIALRFEEKFLMESLPLC